LSGEPCITLVFLVVIKSLLIGLNTIEKLYMYQKCKLLKDLIQNDYLYARLNC